MEIKEPRAEFIRMQRDLLAIKWMLVMAQGGITFLVLKAFFP